MWLACDVLLFNWLMPDHDSYPDLLAEIVTRLMSGDKTGADCRMASIAYARQVAGKRRSMPRDLMVRLYRRDHWTCRYCGKRTIFYPVMPLLGSIFPEHFPWHSNWKAGLTHPAVVECSSVIDHIVPGAAGGQWLDEGNLVTACWPCNARKGDLTLEQMCWELKPVAQSTWDGLSGCYPQLWEIAGRPAGDAHPQWLRALGDGTAR